MVENYLFFAAGLIGLCFAFGHAWWIQKRVIGVIERSDIENEIKRAIFIFLHYTTSTLLISSAVLLIAAVVSDVRLIRPLTWFIVAINAGNLFVFIGANLKRNMQELKKEILQIIIMLVWLGIIIAGII